MNHTVYELRLPRQQTTPVVFASPHSGREYPVAFLSKTILDNHMVRSSEDAFVDQLFAGVVDHGASLLSARFPRAYLDLNRSADELDPALIEGLRRRIHSPRIASGLGVVPRVVAGGRQIYHGKISMSEVQRRIDDCWVPYHNQLQRLLDDTRAKLGSVALIDCHSMPHEAVETLTRDGNRRPEVVIGDRFGASASSALVDGIEAAFQREGLYVTRNSPFAGAYTVQHYGRPGRNQHAIQIEIDRSLYMDERTIRPRADFADFQAMITRITAEICEIMRPSMPLAAE